MRTELRGRRSANAVRAAADSASSGADEHVQLQSATYGVTEGAANVILTLTRSSASGAATVTYTTVNGTATAGTDFVATSGTASWATGDGSAKTITVSLNNPGIPSGTRTFAVSLSSPRGGLTLGANASATATVTPSGAQYRSPFVDPNGNSGVAASAYTGSIPAYQHIVMTQ